MKKSIFIKIIIPVAAVLLINTCFSCKSPTGPDSTLGRRDYTWTVDTIKIPNNNYANLFAMWGSSPTDIWIAGFSYTYKDDAWHYDGKSWQANPILSPGSPTTIFGFASNNVWAGCTNGDIFHYDGSGWSKNTTIIVDSLGPMFIENIWGSSPSDIYCVGYAGDTGVNYKGIIYHYANSKWKILQINNIKTIFNRVFKNSSNIILLDGLAIHEKQDNYRIYQLDGQNVNEITRTGYSYYLALINNNFYIVIGQKIYKFQKSNLELWKDFTGTNYGGFIWGRTENDFFTINYDGIGHYNGIDLITIFKSDTYYYQNAMVLSSDVFFYRSTPDNINLIIHGKLK